MATFFLTNAKHLDITKGPNAGTKYLTGLLIDPNAPRELPTSYTFFYGPKERFNQQLFDADADIIAAGGTFEPFMGRRVDYKPETPFYKTYRENQKNGRLAGQIVCDSKGTPILYHSQSVFCHMKFDEDYNDQGQPIKRLVFQRGNEPHEVFQAMSQLFIFAVKDASGSWTLPESATNLLPTGAVVQPTAAPGSGAPTPVQSSVPINPATQMPYTQAELDQLARDAQARMGQ